MYKIWGGSSGTGTTTHIDIDMAQDTSDRHDRNMYSTVKYRRYIRYGYDYDTTGTKNTTETDT